MSQNSGSRHNPRKPTQAQPKQQGVQSSVKSESALHSAASSQASAQNQAARDVISPPSGAVTLDPVQFTALVDQVIDTLKGAQLGISSAAHSAADELKGSQPGQPGVFDPTLDKNPLRDEHRKNIEAHRRKRWFAFWGISVISTVFFGMLIAIFWQIISDNYLLFIIGAADKSWQWHILVFLGGALVLAAAVPLSLAMALVKMISDTEKSGGDGSSDLKAPGIELAKAIIDLCRSVTDKVGK